MKLAAGLAGTNSTRAAGEVRRAVPGIGIEPHGSPRRRLGEPSVFVVEHRRKLARREHALADRLEKIGVVGDQHGRRAPGGLPASGISGSVGRPLTRAVKYAMRPMSSPGRSSRHKTQRPRHSGRGLAPSHRSAWGGMMQQQDRALGARSQRFTAVPRSHAAILPPLGSPSIIEIARHMGLALCAPQGCAGAR